MSTHIIHKQQVTLKIAKQEHASTVQNTVSALLQNGLLEILENTFDEIAPDGEIVRIDTLQIDLGIIEAENIEQLFKDRLVQEIRKAVIANRDRARNESKSIVREEGGTTVIHPKKSLFEAFLYFLQYGTKPWYNAIDKIEAWEAAMLQQFTARDWQNIIVWLQEKKIQQPVIVQRLATQFSDNFLDRLVREILPLEQYEWRTIHKDIIALFSFCSGKREIEIKAEIWNNCIITILDEQQKVNPFYAIIKNCCKQLAVPLSDFVKYSSSVDNSIQADVIHDAVKQLADEVNRQEEFYSFVNKDEIPSKDITHTDDSNTDVHATNVTDTDSQYNKEDTGAENNTVMHKEIEDAPGKQTKKKYNAGDIITNEAQYVNNSGIVLLHPFLQMYFDELELLHERKFVSVDACKRAVLLLHYLATGETEIAEFDLLLQKIMCNLPLEETLPNKLELTDKEEKESTAVLQSVINYWPPLKNTSVEGLQSTFLQRGGKLTAKDNSWLLTVEQKTVDILLEKLPWGFSTIRLPWMSITLSVDWC